MQVLDIYANDSGKGLRKKLIHLYFFNILRKIRSYIQDFLGGRKLSLLIVSRLVGKKPLPVSEQGLVPVHVVYWPIGCNFLLVWDRVLLCGLSWL